MIINVGTARNGYQRNERLTGYLSAMLTFALRDAIGRTCNGWQEQGGRCPSSRELALPAGHSVHPFGLATSTEAQS